MQNSKEFTLNGLKGSPIAVATHAVSNKRQNPTDRNQKNRNVHIVEEEAGMTSTLITPVCGSHIEKQTLILDQIGCLLAHHVVRYL